MLTRSNTPSRAPTAALVLGARIASIVCAFYMPISAAQAQTKWVADYEYSVSKIMTLSMNAGEVQSTVVKPGLKAECPAGRFLASNDRGLRLANQKKIADGVVLGRDLDNPTGPVIFATFDTPPDIDDRYHGNDHDLLVLNNGDVLLVDQIGSKIDIKPEERPDWWDSAHVMEWVDRDDHQKGLQLLNPDFGPGARISVMIYRSTDCGESFQYLSDFESAKLLDGSCPYPHGGWTATRKGADPEDIWYRGGTDGTLTIADGKTGRLYMTHQCGGLEPTSTDPWLVKACPKHKSTCNNNPLNKTLIAASDDGGLTWDALGYRVQARWRSDIVALSPDLIASVVRDGVNFGRQVTPGNWEFDDGYVLLADYDNPPFKGAYAGLKKKYGGVVGAGQWAPRALTRAPGSATKIMAAFPITIDSGPNQGNGFRIILYDAQTNIGYETAPIMPQSNSLDDFVLHLTAIDIGRGPVLLYWSDFNMTSNTSTVRGRLILSETQYTSDFPVARNSSTSSSIFQGPIPDWKHTWNVITPNAYWYGDYQTAWGYQAASTTQIMAAEGQTSDILTPQGPSILQEATPEDQTSENLKSPATYHFYPVWPEPFSTVKYAHVSVLVDWKPVPQLPEGLTSIIRLRTNGMDAQDRRTQGVRTQAGAPPEVQIRTVDLKTRTTPRRVAVSRLPPDAPVPQPSSDDQQLERSNERSERQPRRD